MWEHGTQIVAQIEDAYEEVFELYSSGRQDQWKHNHAANQKATVVEFDSGSGHSVTIHQSQSLQAKSGQTGAVIWDSTPLLLNVLRSYHSSLLPNLDYDIIELGSGTGALGIALHDLFPRWLFTDQQELLGLLHRNVKRNLASGGWTVAEVNWHDALDVELAQRQYRAVIACDCVYHEGLIDDFLQTCHSLASVKERPRYLSHSLEGATPVIIAQELRSDSVHLQFLETALEQFRVYRLLQDCIPKEFQQGYIVYIMFVK